MFSAKFMQKFSEMSDPIEFKAILLTPGKLGDAKAIQVRRFNIEKNAVFNWQQVAERLQAVFGLPDNWFSLFWKDEDGDFIAISSIEDLQIALSNTSEPFKIFVQQKQNPNVGLVHPNVSCDGCDSIIVGKRFKCMECPDFDLCQLCENANKHDDHMMIRINRPDSILALNVPKKLMKYLRKRGGCLYESSDENENVKRKCSTAGDGHGRRKHHYKGKRGRHGHHDSDDDDDEENEEGCDRRHYGRYARRPHSHLSHLSQVVPSLKHVVESIFNAIDPFVVATGGNTENLSQCAFDKNKEQPATQNSTSEVKSEPNKASNENRENNASSDPINPQIDLNRLFQQFCSPASREMAMSTINNVLQHLQINENRQPAEPGWTFVNRESSDPKPSTSTASNDKESAKESGNGNGEAGKPMVIDIDETAPSAPLDNSPNKNVLVQSALEKMVSMGFSNEGGLLTQLLEIHNGDIYKALEVLQVIKK